MVLNTSSLRRPDPPLISKSAMRIPISDVPIFTSDFWHYQRPGEPQHLQV